ncbi:glycosyltransferase, partial [Amylibacter sp.]|nr:glycosyltransferase [Amylibacter sp.]
NELSKMGAQRVKFLWQAYCATTHRPLDLPSSVAPSDVTFIGSAEEQRYEVLRYLANNGIALSVFGSGWDKKRYQRHSHLLEINKFDLIGLEYAEKIYNSKINLCFLRKMNNDLHTSRSIEIPACGGFMLAEKTNEHEDLFTDKLEAVYFDNKEDLLGKIIYYLENRKVRERIAGNGFLRTRQSDYSYDAMVNNILKELNDE